jgi:hypothetical protein
MNSHAKSRVIIIISLITLLLIVSGIIYKVINNNFKDDLEVISDHALNSDYQLLFVEFFDDSLRYPQNLEELFDYYSEDSLYVKDIKKLLIDPFSKNQFFFSYIPVYSKFSKLPEGYLLISAGIDGHLEQKNFDTIYSENISNLKFYNNLPQADQLTFRKYKIKFSIWDYFFGHCDFLIENTDGIASFIKNCKNRIWSPTVLMRKLSPFDLIKRIDCTVEGDVKEFSQDTLIVYDGLTAVICSMYKGRKYDITNFGKVRIAGQYKNKIDPLHRAIFLDNCIMLTDDSIP